MRTKYVSQNRILKFIAGTIFTGALVAAGLADVFTVDTNQSSLTISGSIQFNGSNPLTTQGAGSLTTVFGGNIQLSQASGTLQFPGQSLVQGQNNGNWQPKADGSSGSAPANAGGQVSALGQTVLVALRNIVFDATSPPINVSGGQFDSSSVVFGFSTNSTGSVTYNAGFFGSGVKSLAGYATNKVTALASLTTVGNQQTLTIPVDATFILTLIGQNDTTLNVKGKFVAVRSATPTFAVGSVSVSNQVVILKWQGTPGQFYQVLSSTNLTTWRTNAANVSSSTSDVNWSGPITAPKQYFRLLK